MLVIISFMERKGNEENSCALAWWSWDEMDAEDGLVEKLENFIFLFLSFYLFCQVLCPLPTPFFQAENILSSYLFLLVKQVLF